MPSKRSKKSNFVSSAIAYMKIDCSSQQDQGNVVSLPHEDSPVVKQLESGLLVTYLVDTRDSFQYVQYRHLQESGFSEEELHQTGLANLYRFVTDGKVRVQPHGNIFGVFVDGNFEASMLLLDSLWADDLRQFVAGEYAVAFPTRDVLGFCDASSKVGIKELTGLIDRLQDSDDHPLSQDIFVRNGNKWVKRNRPIRGLKP